MDLEPSNALGASRKPRLLLVLARESEGVARRGGMVSERSTVPSCLPLHLTHACMHSRWGRKQIMTEACIPVPVPGTETPSRFCNLESAACSLLPGPSASGVGGRRTVRAGKHSLSPSRPRIGSLGRQQAAGGRWKSTLPTPFPSTPGSHPGRRLAVSQCSLGRRGRSVMVRPEPLR